MKHIIICLTACILFCTQVHAQKTEPTDKKATGGNDCCCKDTTAYFENDKNYKKQPANGSKDIILDFRAKALGIPVKAKFKKGDYIRVKVVNYNPFLYKVNVDNRDSSVAQPNDAGLLGMFLSPDKFSSAAANLINPLTTGTPPKQIPAPKLSDAQIKAFAQKWGTAEGVQLVYDTDTKTVKIDTAAIITPFLNRYINDAKNKKTKIQQLRKHVEENLAGISKLYADLQKLYIDCSEFSDTMIRRKAVSYETSLKNLLAESRSIALELSDSAMQFKFNLAEYLTYINTYSFYKVRYSFIDTFYKIATAELVNIDTSISRKKINEIYTGLIKLTQNAICYTSLPIYISSDVKVFTINLKPVDDKSNLPSYQTNFAIPDYQYRVWGVSGGIFVSGLHNNIYSNRRKENDTAFNLIADKQGKLQLGVNALAYMGWQIQNNRPNYLGASFGAGMSLESKLKPRVLLGISYITGEKNRISFSAGFVGGYVSELSDAFSTTVNYTKPAENYQKDILKGNGFISINYSFLSK